MISWAAFCGVVRVRRSKSDRGLLGVDGFLVVGELEAGVAGDVGADSTGMDRGRRDSALLDVEFGAQCVGESARRRTSPRCRPDWLGMPRRPKTLEMLTTWPSPDALK